MFKFRRRAKSDSKPACLNEQRGRVHDAQSITYEFVASFDADTAGNHPGSDDSGIYTMSLEDNFAVLRDAQVSDGNESATNKKTQASVVANKVSEASTRIPKIIAVILEPDGQSRFFHPEESRRAERPIWRPLQRVES